jgi:hypothetical protein
MNVPSVLVEKQTHTPLSFAMLTTCALADESSTPGKNACLITGQNDVCDFPVDAACIKCSRPLPANDSVMGASLNVLSMLCGSNIVARSAAPTLCKSALPGYTAPNAVNPAGGICSPVRKADDRRSAVFFRPSHGKPLWAGCAGAASAAPVPSFRSANPAQFRSPRFAAGWADFSTKEGVIAMAHKARIASSAPAPDTNPELINAYQLNGIDNKLDDIYQFVRYISKQVFRNAIKRELCAGLKLASLLDLPAKDVTLVMQ